MLSLRKVIDSTLRGNNSFCCLCLDIDQQQNFSNLNDIITLNINNKDHYLTIQEILEPLLAPEINHLSENDYICSKCVESAMNSYTFIQTSKSNMLLLTKAIETLSETAANATYELTDDKKSLYLSLDIENLTGKYIFASKTVKHTKSSKKRLIVNKEENPAIKVKRQRQNFLTKYHDSKFVKGQWQNLLPKYQDATKLYKCSQCSLIFIKQRLLKKHERENHTTYPCTLCDKILSSSQALKRHELYHTSSFVCQFCGRTYKTKHSYDTHIKLNICKRETRANPSDAKFTCDYCNKKYTQKVSLRVHIQFEHGKYKAHICEWCGKKFWAQSRLKAHLVKHTKERNFVCSICGGKFVTKEALLYHTRLHTGEKPYKCTECNSRFLSASRRSDHMKRYHAGTCFQCNTCPSRFNSRIYLERHQETCQRPQKSKFENLNNDIKVRYVKNKIEINKNQKAIEEVPVSELEEISDADGVPNLIYQMAYNNIGQEDNVTSYGIVL